MQVFLAEWQGLLGVMSIGNLCDRVHGKGVLNIISSHSCIFKNVVLLYTQLKYLQTGHIM